MGPRRKGRILAFQVLYAWAMAGRGSKKDMLGDLLGFPWLDEDKRTKLGESADFARLIVTGTIGNIGDVDSMIKAQLQNWDFSRLNMVDLALLRMSVYVLMFQKEIPPTVVIDEAIDISKDYGTDDSYRFINGVLDSVRKTIQTGI
jgi:N utilization substance protein B